MTESNTSSDLNMPKAARVVLRDGRAQIRDAPVGAERPVDKRERVLEMMRKMREKETHGKVN